MMLQGNGSRKDFKIPMKKQLLNKKTKGLFKETIIRDSGDLKSID
jgi:hypothetical protein